MIVKQILQGELNLFYASINSEYNEPGPNESYTKLNTKNCTKEDIIKNICPGKNTIQQVEEVKNEILNKNYTKENNIIIGTENVISKS